MMPMYEFRLFDGGILLAVHIAECGDDSAACQRARAYLRASNEFDAVVIRGGSRFMRQVGVEYAKSRAIAVSIRPFA